MQTNGISVFASGALTGDLIRSDVEEDMFLFTYDRDCQSNCTVSLTMPITRTPYDSMGTIHPIFEMNLPEGALREKLERMFSKVVPNFDALSLLQIIGKSQIGRLRYAQKGVELEEVPTQKINDLLSYTGAEDLFNDLLARFAQHSGISGMQPKVLIRDENEQSLNRLTHRGATHIVKSFEPREYPELAANEFFCMEASRYAGLPTALVQLSENRKMLVVERFDILDQTYLGFEDFCVLSGMRSGGRYNSSYEKLAERIKRYVSPEHLADSMSHYFGAVALACTIRNGDAHLKNFGVIYNHPNSDVRLAPVYDMLSTKPYQPEDILALELNGSKKYPSRQELIQFGRQACGLSNGSVNSMLDRVIHGVSQSILDMSKFTESHPDFELPMNHFSKVFQDGIRSLTNSS